jgi:hypothetical protein
MLVSSLPTPHISVRENPYADGEAGEVPYTMGMPKHRWF